MRLTDEEQAMLDGQHGRARQWAIQHQIEVGDFFDAADFVPVGQSHIMADTESLGEEGVRWLESLAAMPDKERHVRIPTITDPRGLDFDSYRKLKQTDAMADLESRASAAFVLSLTGDFVGTTMVLTPSRWNTLAGAAAPPAALAAADPVDSPAPSDAGAVARSRPPP